MTSIDVLREFFGWCLVISLVFYLLTTGALMSFRHLVCSVSRRAFGMDEASTMRGSFDYVARFKLAIIVLFLTPYIALRIMA